MNKINKLINQSEEKTLLADMVDFLKSFRIVYDDDPRNPVIVVFNRNKYTNTFPLKKGDSISLQQLYDSDFFDKFLSKNS